MVIQNDMSRGELSESELLTGFVPKLMAVGYLSSALHCDAVHYDAAARGEVLLHLRHDVFEVSAVSADEDGIWRCDRVATNGTEVATNGTEVATNGTEVANMDMDAWGTEAAGILLDDGLALRTYLKGFDVQMGKLQAGLDADAARAEADVPEHMTAWEVESLECQQTDGHLGNHLLAPVKECEGLVGDAKGTGGNGSGSAVAVQTTVEDDAVGVSEGAL